MDIIKKLFIPAAAASVLAFGVMSCDQDSPKENPATEESHEHPSADGAKHEHPTADDAKHEHPTK